MTQETGDGTDAAPGDDRPDGTWRPSGGPGSPGPHAPDGPEGADGPGGPGGPGGGSRWRTRRRLLAGLAVGVVAAVAVGTALVLRDDSSGAAAEGAGPPATLAVGAVACARVIAEGTVARTEPQGDRTRVVLTVNRYLKPAKGPRETEFTVPGTEAGYFTTGDRMLVSVPRSPGGLVQSYTGAEIALEWQRMAAELPGTRGTCDGTGAGAP
ncbi:hypothetical protein ACFVIM_00865 [Streptomyces sp. NPDC057638]|uniref:hypothetical protein n=1 Tax=Streptomyces sp. NPDC057638 TaxID=3346190 RepID=UPI0036C76CA7